MDASMYDAQADNIDVDDIAENSNNRFVLRRIQRNNANDDIELYIQNRNGYNYGGDFVGYVPEGANDMGWLGYFIGKNQFLDELHIEAFTPTSGASVRDVIEPFFRGVGCNKSIEFIRFNGVDLLGGDMFTMLGSFFQNNYNLNTIVINECNFGNEWGRLFALALGSSTNESLRHVDLLDNDISEEGMVDIITAFGMYPNLEHLDLDGNRLRKNGCVALATLLQCSAKELRYLYISNCDIGDESLEALVPALANCYHLQSLNICNSPSITTRGWQRFASILEAPNSNLKGLSISGNNIDDETVAALVNAFANNTTVQKMYLDDNPSITAIGWEAFTSLLCDTSSVNATFLSNHTLLNVETNANVNDIFGTLLRLNERDDKKEVATIKVLQSHEDFDMLPFFEWEFKVLPLVIGWFERASEYNTPEDFGPNLEERKLSTIYQFVRGLPLLYVEIRLRKELEDIEVAESQLEEEGLQEEYLQHKLLLQERKEIIMRKLSGKLQQS